MRLGAGTLGRLPAAVERFDYDRDAQAVGIVHIGIGAFHRAHQAWYTDRAMDGGDRDWAILGVSMRSSTVADQLMPQDGLYTVTERAGADPATRLVGAVKGVLMASRERQAIVNAIAAPTTRIVSFTVTEKGYCRAPNGTLDLSLARDGSFYPLLAEGLRRRRDSGLGGLSLMSCDNLADNGGQLRALMAGYLAATAPDLSGWFAAECSCPSTMVDRIVPATGGNDIETLFERIGVEDAAAVFTEPFSQWVIEDRFVAGRPAWDGVGAQLVADVTPYETAKLRMLNGAHSALAYAGLERGHSFVHEAIADPVLRDLVEALMRGEAAPTIAPAPGQDLNAYADALIQRFGNAALHHRLSQIAMDGSQKLPQRWLETLSVRASAGETCPAILRALAAWLRYVRVGPPVVHDPLAAQLAKLWRSAGPTGIVDALFSDGGLLGGWWTPTSDDRAVLEAILAN